jgi:hypothetical protein
MRSRRPRYQSLPQGLKLVAWFRSRLRLQSELRGLGSEQLVGHAFKLHGCPPHSQADWDAWLSAALLAKRLESAPVQAQIQAMRNRLRGAEPGSTGDRPVPVTDEEPER